MATVDLRFTALPAHARTARLLAASVARRAGLEETLLDELKLAVGEACARAVVLNRAHAPDSLVAVALRDDRLRFTVEVTDDGPAVAGAAAPRSVSAALTDEGGQAEDDTALAAEIGLALLEGLVDAVDVRAGEHGGSVVTMSWPLARS